MTENGKIPTPELAFPIDGGKLLYRQTPHSVSVVGVEGRASRVEIPAKIAGRPVTEIGKKAFFDCRYLHFLRLPCTIQRIDSWAFAHCPLLERVELPHKQIALGKDLFIGSDRLREIVLTAPEAAESEAVVQEAAEVPDTVDGEEIAELLAAAAIRMDAPLLFSIKEAGSREWLEKWDARMLVILRADDNEGFDKEVATGEEDYERTDQARYRRLQRMGKVRLALMRLLHPRQLRESVRIELEGYLRAHTKGCRTQEAWEVLYKEYGDRKEYYELFTQLGCVTQENFDGILQDMGEEHTEMKAYLMRYKEEKLGYRDFFDSLSLDF